MGPKCNKSNKRAASCHTARIYSRTCASLPHPALGACPMICSGGGCVLRLAGADAELPTGGQAWDSNRRRRTGATPTSEWRTGAARGLIIQALEASRAVQPDRNRPVEQEDLQPGVKACNQRIALACSPTNRCAAMQPPRVSPNSGHWIITLSLAGRMGWEKLYEPVPMVSPSSLLGQYPHCRSSHYLLWGGQVSAIHLPTIGYTFPLWK